MDLDQAISDIPADTNTQLSDDDKKKCVKVDKILGRQDVIIKNLGDYIKHAPSIMGCTILSDNQLILILNSWEIVNSRKNKNSVYS